MVLTVPSRWVVVALRRLHLADGMSLDEHHGFDPRRTPDIFRPCGFALEHRGRFQLGLNYLFVIRKPNPDPAADRRPVPARRPAAGCDPIGEAV